MTTIVAGATGNWSATGTWVGGVVPGAGDTAQTGNYVVTIDVSVTCTLNPTGSGRFDVTTGGITITGDVNMNSTYSGGGIRCSHTSGTVTITGKITAAGTHGLVNYSSGAVIVGETVGGSGGYGVVNASSGVVTVGISTAGTGAHGAFNTGSGSLIVGLAIGNNFGPSSGGESWCAGVYGNSTTGAVVKVGAIQSGPRGGVAIGGAVLLDDSVTNTAEFRTVLNGATKTLEESGGGGGGGLFYPVVGASIIRGVKI